MANLNNQEHIGKAFVSQHIGKQSNIENWRFRYPLDLATKKEKYAIIFSNLMAGIYGEVRGLNAEYDEDDNLIKEATEFEIEISAGNVFTFDFEEKK